MSRHAIQKFGKSNSPRTRNSSGAREPSGTLVLQVSSSFFNEKMHLLTCKSFKRLPENISLDLGAIIEPLAVAMHASGRAQLPRGSTVLVFGAGAMGLLCAAVTKASKQRAVIIADVLAERVSFAVDNGFADGGIVVPTKRPETIEEKLTFAKEIAAMVNGTVVNGERTGEVSACYECTGVENCLQAAIYVSVYLRNHVAHN